MTTTTNNNAWPSWSASPGAARPRSPSPWRAPGGPASPRTVGPYAFTAREARWGVSFSGDGTAVTYASTYFHAAYDRAGSCAGCDLDRDTIVTVNRGYLAALAATGGSELPVNHSLSFGWGA